MIVSGAFNIFPREVETCCRSTPMSPGRVVGIPDDKWGEASPLSS